MAHNLRILMLEDDLDDAALAIATLERAGYRCVCDLVETRAAFLEHIAHQRYDVVLSNYDLPALGGISALRLLRAHDDSVPFILLSGALGEETAIESLKIGVTDYVLKSHITRLPAVVARALRARDDQHSRQQAEQALRLAEARYRDLFENANDMIYTRDLNGCFTSVNGQGERLTGYTRDEFLRMRLEDLLAPEYLHLSAEEVLRAHSEVALTIPGEMEFICKGGRRVWVEVSSRLLYEDGRPVGVQGIARDISERQRARQERRQLEDQLIQSQKMESIGTFAGGIAHDFNNMLTVIIGNIQMMLEAGPAHSPDYPMLLEVEKAALRAASLTRQLLTFSRRQPIERRLIDLNSTISDLWKMLLRIIGEDVAVTVQLAPQLPLILADPVQIQQVLMNLVVNARDAMPGGGQLVITTDTVELDAAGARSYPWLEPGSYIRLRVSDTGVGIDDSTLQRMFEPFFTTKELDRGTGLGLSVVYGIVQQHEGSIGVESAPGRGTTFTILLPPPKAPQPADADVPAPRARGGSETILVAEDEPSLRYLAALALERLGYTVLLAEDGQAALELFRADPARIDLLVLDLVMPRYGGREAFEQMRVQRPDIRALFITGYGESARWHAPAPGPLPGTGILQKPYRVDVLGARVRELLDQRG